MKIVSHLLNISTLFYIKGKNKQIKIIVNTRKSVPLSIKSCLTLGDTILHIETQSHKVVDCATVNLVCNVNHSASLTGQYVHIKSMIL